MKLLLRLKDFRFQLRERNSRADWPELRDDRLKDEIFELGAKITPLKTIDRRDGDPRDGKLYSGDPVGSRAAGSRSGAFGRSSAAEGREMFCNFRPRDNLYSMLCVGKEARKGRNERKGRMAVRQGSKVARKEGKVARKEGKEARKVGKEARQVGKEGKKARRVGKEARKVGKEGRQGYKEGRKGSKEGREGGTAGRKGKKEGKEGRKGGTEGRKGRK
ncbi:hypothetical protein EYF80_048687 [Liparis tanakae]|uniref:Uncharacterized protein n=1 Tax=Liparis tanakae TaxID=230148 RepID=A0A4Z2FK34_9TELE|nr:hypothetical protein EYF80_048687 [Liparis tanakae]